MNTSTQEPSATAENNRLRTAPRADITGNADRTIVRLDLPGVTREGLEITIEEQQLSITGRRAASPVSGRRINTEIRPLDFRRVFELSPSIDTTRITADLADGVLTLTLPTAEKVKPRQIPVS